MTAGESRPHFLGVWLKSDGIAHALEAGASGALLKTVEYPELIAAIRAVAIALRKHLLKI